MYGYVCSFHPHLVPLRLDTSSEQYSRFMRCYNFYHTHPPTVHFTIYTGALLVQPTAVISRWWSFVIVTEQLCHSLCQVVLLDSWCSVLFVGLSLCHMLELFVCVCVCCMSMASLCVHARVCIPLFIIPTYTGLCVELSVNLLREFFVDCKKLKTIILSKIS